MSIERPLYRFSVTNVDQGWTYTITHREEPPALEDVTVILADGLNMTWGFSNDQVPGPLDPDTCSFKLYVKSAEFLPDIEPGDIILADLDRPGPDAELIPYMHFAGRASDPDLEVSPSRGIFMSVQATGVFDDFSANVLWEDPPGHENVIDGGLTDETMAGAIDGYTINGVYIQNNWRLISHRQYLLGEGMTLLDFVTRIEAGLQAGDDQEIYYALRSTYDWHPLAGPDDDGWTQGLLRPDRPISYYFDGSRLTLPAPMILAEDDTDPDMIVLVPGLLPSFPDPPEELDDVVVISARHVVSPAGLRKTRGDIVNDIDISGIDHSVTPNVEVRKRYRDTVSIARYGTSTRTVDTNRPLSSLPGVADKFLHGSSGGSEWALPELAVTTANMDDDELDQLAPTFYPHAPAAGYGGTLGRFMVLADLPERVAIGADALAVQLVGASFDVSGGDITITPRVRSIPPANFATAITFDELAASTFADATFVDTGAGHYIDPALDIDELIYTDI